MAKEMLEVIKIIANATGDDDLEHAQELSLDILSKIDTDDQC